MAYFSSIALLGLAASQEASSDGMGDTTTYFDSVVFLTMFLLIGKFDHANKSDKTTVSSNRCSHLKQADT